MSDRARNTSMLPLALLGIGLLGVIATWFSGGAMRFAANWISWYVIGLSIFLGSIFIIALEHLVGARWSIPMRRVPERITTLIGPLFLIGLVASVLGAYHFYEWGTPAFMEMAAADHHLHAKHLWFSKPFFFGRLLFSFLVWAIAYKVFVLGSFAQDSSRDPRQNLGARKFAPPFMFLFAITLSLSAFDFLMSVEPRWYSTIFGVYFFSVCVLTGIATITLLVLRQLKLGRLPQVRPDHLYSLGGLMFAFTVFWTYISFSQFMLYWYGNLPFEIFWYLDRLSGGWYWLTLGLSVARFVVPFVALLSRAAKTDVKRLAWVSKWIIGTTMIDIYWVIFPSLGRMSGTSHMVFGWQEISFALFFLSLGTVLLRRSMERGADMPVGDANLKAGLEFHL
ncbi:MAG: hypothetical protein KDC10_01520 [Calditrichaeota bacterium]|nr:hypothetical protein [Candidatus Cloacimonadota bacterium]MCB1045852.1 hypothetical protein [Calditrichota bacterium]MCB9473720.1 hypothetical protein [Candidatus Delongbacteria bacterium]